jgi:hypothetical protein
MIRTSSMHIRSAIILSGFLLLTILLFSGYLGDTEAAWGDTKVPCASSGQEPRYRSESTLRIVVDGALELIPPNIGVSPECTAEVFARDASGTITVESSESNPSYTLIDFFAVWGTSFAKEGYDASILVDGVLVKEPGDVYLRNGQSIIVTYTKIH